ncbi:MAG: chromate transporter, partial [Oscillospiraceae bacterium]|nr:chromate transporter [Oscillospiraceae bacterium]
MIYLQLFWEFLKVGLFTVGGGLASLPFLYDISDKTGWYTHAQLADMVAISESTPGPIGINM